MKSPWTLRLLALAGFLIALYLFILKATGEISSIVGCGTGSGCANVLGSEWSQFFGIPVSALAALMYLMLLFATWVPSRRLYAAFAICFTGAALWFFGLLIVEVKAFCMWCTAMHVIGLTCSLLLVLALRRMEKPSHPEAGPIRFAPLGAVAALLVLALGQIYGPKPDTHLTTVGGSMEGEDKATSVHAGGSPRPGNGTPAPPPDGALTPAPAPTPAPEEGRTITVYDDDKYYNTATLPHLGSSNAPHVIVKYYDYTCDSCLDVHKHLQFVNEKHPGKFCMIMLPVPLSRECNEFFAKPYANHEFACELARLSLAAWLADPGRWPEVHETLFTRPVLTAEVAEIATAQVIGEEALAKAMKDPWINEMINANSNDFRQLTVQNRAMPKLLVGKGRMLHGLPRSKELLLQSLEQDFKLPPAK